MYELNVLHMQQHVTPPAAHFTELIKCVRADSCALQLKQNCKVQMSVDGGVLVQAASTVAIQLLQQQHAEAVFAVLAHLALQPLLWPRQEGSWWGDSMVYLIVRESNAVHLQVTAVAYDNPIPGFHTNNTINLRLWAAKPDREFDLEAFNTGDYVQVSLTNYSLAAA